MANTEVEIFLRFNAKAETLQDALAFVMEYMDEAGPEPSVEINACYDDELVFHHYHAAVFGVVKDKKKTPPLI